MHGFCETLDGSNQWMANAQKMVVAQDPNAYHKIFMRQPGEVITGQTVGGSGCLKMILKPVRVPVRAPSGPSQPQRRIRRIP